MRSVEAIIEKYREGRDRVDPATLEAISAPLRIRAKRAAKEKGYDDDRAYKAANYVMEALLDYDGQDHRAWFDTQLAIGLGERKPPQDNGTEQDDDHAAHGVVAKLREALPDNMSGLIAELYDERIWEGAENPKTFEHFMRGYVLNPDMIQRLGAAHGSPERDLFLGRLRALVDHIGGEWEEYTPLLGNADFTRDELA